MPLTNEQRDEYRDSPEGKIMLKALKDSVALYCNTAFVPGDYQTALQGPCVSFMNQDVHNRAHQMGIRYNGTTVDGYETPAIIKATKARPVPIAAPGSPVGREWAKVLLDGPFRGMRGFLLQKTADEIVSDCGWVVPDLQSVDKALFINFALLMRCPSENPQIAMTYAWLCSSGLGVDFTNNAERMLFALSYQCTDFADPLFAPRIPAHGHGGILGPNAYEAWMNGTPKPGGRTWSLHVSGTFMKNTHLLPTAPKGFKECLNRLRSSKG